MTIATPSTPSTPKQSPQVQECPGAPRKGKTIRAIRTTGKVARRLLYGIDTDGSMHPMFGSSK